MDAIHRALSSFSRAFSDCSHSARPDFGVGGAEPSLFLSAPFTGFLPWPGYASQQPRPQFLAGVWTQWRIFRRTGYAAHVGRILLTFHVLAMLGAKDKTQPSHTRLGIALAIAVGLVAWTGYRGGQLALGADHLTEHMPAGLRDVLGLQDSHAASSTVDTSTFYGARIHPIFAARCVNCHGPDKHKANLQLDSYRGIMRGGKDGPVVQPGNAPGSDLFRRITLPANHDDFMPKGKKSLVIERSQAD